MIGIRADGNHKIGTGHIMRCLAIAGELRALGEEPVFLCEERNEMVERQGFRCVTLGGVYDDLSNEDLSACLAEQGIQTLLVDTYFADTAYFSRLPCKTAYLFDMGDAAAACDLLVDYNVNYGEYSFPNAKKTLLGPQYAPLRREFRANTPRDISRVRTVLVSTGGTDEQGVTEKIIRRLCGMRRLEFAVVVGTLNRWKVQLREMAAQCGNVKLYENVEDMAALMRACDLAISAGGSTLYELCACALPSIAFSIAGNQDDMINAMAEQGVMLSAGRFAGGEEQFLAHMQALLERLAADAALRKKLSRTAGALVDGKGAERIARAILEL